MKYFQFVLALIIGIVFILNSEHVAQQLSYSNILLPASESLVNDFQYDYKPFNHLKTYPIWGYSLLLLPEVILNSGGIFILILQGLLCYAGCLMIFSLSSLKRNLWGILLLFPYISLMSVKWPDAIVLFLLTSIASYYWQYRKSNNVRYILYITICFGIILNLRGEYLLLLPIFVLLDYIKFRKREVLLMLLSAFFLLPWVVRNYVESNKIIVTSTNSGAVSYISLGQLPGNDWGIRPVDQTAYEIADSLGYASSYTIRANTHFRNEYKRLAFDKPIEFTKKVIYNMSHIIWGGLYTGEFANKFIEESRLEIDAVVNGAKGLDKLEALFLFGPKVFFSVMAEKSISVFYRLILIYLIFIIIRDLARGEVKTAFGILCLSVILHKILITGFIQYESRHINQLLPFIIFLSHRKSV